MNLWGGVLLYFEDLGILFKEILELTKGEKKEIYRILVEESGYFR